MEAILQRVVDGAIEPGEWLPREVDLAEQYGVSRGVIREAVQALRERGLVDVRHGRGQWVLPEEHWDLLDVQVLQAVVTARRLDLLSEIVECRRLLEPDAAALAAQRGSDDQIAGLADALAAMREAARLRRHPAALEDPLVRAEVAFHHALAAMTGNRPLIRMLEPVHAALAIARHELAPERHEALVRQHARIRSAVAVRDPIAARKAVESAIRQFERWTGQRPAAAR